MLAYFTALDHEQHGSGPFSPAAYATLERIDAIVGAMLQAAARAYGGNAVIAIVSDHGFQGTNRSVNLISALRSEGLMVYPDGAGDKPTSWSATVWGGGGSAAAMLKDSTDRTTHDEVAALLGKLAADSAIAPTLARVLHVLLPSAEVAALWP